MGAATRGFITEESSLNGKAAAPDASTLSGQSSILHGELSSLENSVEFLESALESVLKKWPTGGGTEGAELEGVPPAVESIRQAGFRAAALRNRLEDLRARLALQ